ncbi:MAG: hypothetical protein RL154_148 [Pseudomonadota bacterium]|jgi:peptide/nickel transport system ATP-binding protein
MFKAKISVLLDKKELLDIEFVVNSSLAIVGQSGSGKSLALKSILDLAPNNMSVSLDYSWQYRLIRGDSVALVPQNPFTALSPKSKIGNNFFCVKNEAVQALEMVGLEELHLSRYPHELSGGQLQRVCLALVLSHKPKLLLLDEPTTALDPDTKVEICLLIKKLQQTYGFLTIFVSHEIDIAKLVCDDVIVLDNGKVAEYSIFSDFITNQISEAGKILVKSGFKNRKFRQ